jgi:endoglucanase
MRQLQISLIFTFLALLFFQQSAYPFLKAKGREIVGENDNPVFLRGVGLGGWLVPEGYMLHIPGYGSPTVIRQMITDLIGEQDAKEFYKRYEANYVNERDIAQIAALGYNSIRLPFNYRMLSPEDQPGVFLEEGFAVFDSLIAWCKKYQLYVILDMHCAPGGQNAGNISDSDGEAKLWTVVSNQDRTVEIWKKIAERYADEEWVAGYDLLNEPVLPTGVTNGDLRNFYKRITLAIREVDPNHIVIVEGNWYATDFSSFTYPILIDNYNNTSNVVYSFHKYWNETDPGTISGYLQLRNNYNVPLWLGETGENSNPWFYEVVQVMEEKNISWCWWTHKKIETTTSPYSASITPGYQRILDYWNGKIPRPDAASARAALFEMAENLALEECEYLPDVAASLFDHEFGAIAKPYVEHHLPGMIDAADFDLGTNGIAYSDNEYKLVNQGATSWNQGYSYRNDGVDIEKSRDSGGAEYGVGWTQDGEWLNYTVNVDTAGTYRADFRVASLGGNGLLTLLLDNQALIQSLPISATGGWYTWKDVESEDIYIPGGTHSLRLRIDRAGFNINRMEFDLKIADSINEPRASSVPNELELRQNYPNPFNSETNISFFLPSAGKVACRIYSVSGELVRQLKNSATAGWNTFHWDGRNGDGIALPSGVYFYQVRFGSYSKTRRMVYLR